MTTFRGRRTSSTLMIYIFAILLCLNLKEKSIYRHMTASTFGNKFIIKARGNKFLCKLPLL